MRISAKEFLEMPRRAVTLLGMSGVGKSHISAQLEMWGWGAYSCDYLIGSKYLKDTVCGDVRLDDISGLSEFIGQVGDAARGGLSLVEFQRRQGLYYDAEVQSLRDACGAIDGAKGHVVVDSSGSLCEIEDESILADLGARSLFVYLKVREDGHGHILARAVDYPKPLYYPPAFLLERLAAFCAQFDVAGVENVDPAAFLRWVFPFLFEARLVKYQRLADSYGVGIYADQFNDVGSEDEFLNIIAKALSEQEQAA